MRIVLLSLLLIALWAAPAAAQDRAESLLAYAPGDSRVLVGLHVKRARDTVAFKEAFRLAREDEFGKQVLSFFEKELDFKPEEQLESVAFALPVKNLRKNAQTFTMIAGGSFDVKQLDALVARRKDIKTRREGKLTVLDLGMDSEFAILNPSTAIFVVGSKKYRAAAWKVANKKAASIQKHTPIKELLDRVANAPHGWLIADTQELPQREDIQTLNTWTSFDFSNGFSMNSSITVGSDEQAKKVVSDMEKSRIPGALALSAYGAQSLSNNLKASHDGAIVKLDTKMTEAEVKGAAAKLADLARRERERLQRRAAEKAAKEQEAAPANATAAP
jgi:hypothetical protein